MAPGIQLGEEYPLPDEAAAIAEITQILEAQVNQDQHKPVPRSQHPKQHGCVWAWFTVAEDLPEHLRQGVFKTPGHTYPAWVRFSSLRQWDDRKGDAHGMAIKLMNVAGEKLLESERDAQTQDFLFTDHPVFVLKNVADYLQFFRERAQSPDRPPFKFLFPSLNPLTWRYREFSILVLALGIGKKIHKLPSPLAAQYWSMTPYRLGQEPFCQPWSSCPHEPHRQAIKFFVKPSAPQLSGKAGNHKDYLRLAMANFLRSEPASFDFYLQLQTDPLRMPIEDPTVEWWGGPAIKVATIQIPPQIFDTPEQLAFGENLSFTPWHALPDHQPLGGINRTRKLAYEKTAHLRHQRNDVPSQEPTPETFRPELLTQDGLEALIEIKTDRH